MPETDKTQSDSDILFPEELRGFSMGKNVDNKKRLSTVPAIVTNIYSQKTWKNNEKNTCKPAKTRWLLFRD